MSLRLSLASQCEIRLEPDVLIAGSLVFNQNVLGFSESKSISQDLHTYLMRYIQMIALSIYNNIRALRERTREINVNAAIQSNSSESLTQL